MSYVLHISDNNLTLQNSTLVSDAPIARSQGYAWLKDDQVLFDINSDDKPVAHCRVAPQQINSRYWQQCAQTAISSNGAGMRHAADLIWKHLAELKAKFNLASLAMVVPANYRDSQLQLLLGVSKATGLEVPALISKPVLAAQQHELANGSAVHVDMQLHQMVISRLSVTGSEISLVDVDVKSELGIHALQESLLHTLQANFIRTDRFDPLHNADTEQQLFDQLPEVVANAVNGEKSTVGVQHQGKLYSTVIDSAEVESALAELLTELIAQLKQAGTSQLIVDTNASFELHKVPSLAVSDIHWVDDAATLASGRVVAELADSKSADGNVIYQTSVANLHSTKTAATALGQSSDETSSGKTSSDQASLKLKPQIEAKAAAANSTSVAATHLMQFGLVVPINQATISTNGAVLALTKSSSQANATDMNDLLSSGGLHIVNDQQRTQLQANDRVMSPVADGVITALAMI